MTKEELAEILRDHYNSIEKDFNNFHYMSKLREKNTIMKECLFNIANIAKRKHISNEQMLAAKCLERVD